MDTSVISLKSSPGFTLLEVLVAIVISTILMAGAIMMLSSNKRIYAVQSELAQLQSNARFVIDEFNRELRIAGYFGCSGTPPSGEPTHPFDGSGNITTAIHTNFPASDKVAINSFNQKMTVVLAQTFVSGTTSFTLDANNNEYWPKAGETIIVSDCLGSDRYTVATAPTETNPTMTISSPGLKKTYFIHPEIFTGKTRIIYEVKSNVIKNAGGEVIDVKFGLYQTRCDNKNGDSNPCESGETEEELLVENVETLQVRYGIDVSLTTPAIAADQIPDFYDAEYYRFYPNTDPLKTTPSSYTTTTTNFWFPVVAVRITLLMRTASKRYDQKKVFTDKQFQLDTDNDSENIPYNPKTNPLESGYRHRIFTSVMAVRNAKK